MVLNMITLEEEKGWVCSMKQSDITTHIEVSNLTGTPGTPLNAAVSEQSVMTYWHLLYPSAELLLPHLIEDTHILVSLCRISFSTRLALDKMVMEIFILKFSL